VPLKKLAVRSVGLTVRQLDHLPSLGIEALSIAELISRAGADHKPVRGIDAEVATIFVPVIAQWPW
jgi:hypothetical protein